MTNHTPPRINKGFAGTCQYILKEKQIDDCFPASVLHDYRKVAIDPEIPLTCSFHKKIDKPKKKFRISWTENHAMNIRACDKKEILNLWLNGEIDTNDSATIIMPIRIEEIE